MIPVLPKFVMPAMICLCLVAGGAWAQTQEQVQERLVDTVKRVDQATARAGEKLKAGDTAGGCSDLHAASTDSHASLDMVHQLLGQIRQDDTLHGDTRNQMLQDLQGMGARLTSQKQGLDAQVAAHCS